MPAMKCPKCREANLVAVVVDEVEVDRCQTCSGIWFDNRELGALLDKARAQLSTLLDGEDQDDLDYQYGKCPRDQQNLMRVKSLRNAEVTLDVCGGCRGIWLDGGEFRAIKDAQPQIRLGDIV